MGQLHAMEKVDFIRVSKDDKDKMVAYDAF